MPKFLIEVQHEDDVIACMKAVQIFLTSGSHFLTNAEWGCYDGDHHSWMIVDVGSKDEARAIVPPGMRAQTRVVQLNRFTMEEIDEILRKHKG
jgi:hypothetical protein